MSDIMQNGKLCLGCGREMDERHFVTQSGRIDTQCAGCRHEKNVKAREAEKTRRHVEAVKAFMVQAKNPETSVMDLSILTTKLVSRLGGPDQFTQRWADMIEAAHDRATAGEISPKIPLDAYQSVGRMIAAAAEQQRDEDVSNMTDEQLRSVIETLSASTELRLADIAEIEDDDEAEGLHADSA